MLRRLTRHPAVQAAGAGLLGLYLALVYRTTRWTLDAEEALALVRATEGPIICAFWHERLPLMPRLWLEVQHRVPAYRPRLTHVLVSRHRDGHFIGAIIRRFAMTTVQGSTSKGGGAGLLALLRLLEGGGVVAITPDGPRGPRRVAAPGVAQLPARSGVAVWPCAAATTRSIRLRSWDRMVIPLPFARGVLVALPPMPVPPDGAEAALPALAAALTAAADRADAWVAERGAARRR